MEEGRKGQVYEKGLCLSKLEGGGGRGLFRIGNICTPVADSCQCTQSLPKPMSIESVMPFNHLILCCPLLLLPSILNAFIEHLVCIRYCLRLWGTSQMKTPPSWSWPSRGKEIYNRVVLWLLETPSFMPSQYFPIFMLISHLRAGALCQKDLSFPTYYVLLLSYSTSLHLSFLICKMGIRTAFASMR